MKVNPNCKTCGNECYRLRNGRIICIQCAGNKPPPTTKKTKLKK